MPVYIPVVEDANSSNGRYFPSKGGSFGSWTSWCPNERCGSRNASPRRIPCKEGRSNCGPLGNVCRPRHFADSRKMEMVISAPHAGKIDQIQVMEGVFVVFFALLTFSGFCQFTGFDC